MVASGSEKPKEIANRTTVSNDTQKQAEQSVDSADIMDINSIKSGIQQMRPMLASIEKLSPESVLATE